MQTETTFTPSIAILAPAVADQIAAGEVVERPAAALKEILENSIDSGATEISVRLSGGGIELIEVIDNGHGIAGDELKLALTRYATSKIHSAQDLNTISTLGFRGEALAAISSVSRFTLSSRTASAATGNEIRVEASRVLSEGPVARSMGTTVRIENLFFNVPARLKFLKTTPYEGSQCSAVVFRAALANPKIQFTLDDGFKFFFRKEDDSSARIADVFREGFGVAIKKEELLPILREKEGIRVHGYLLPQKLNLKSSRGIHTFVNGRPVKDKVLSQAVIAAAKEVSFGGEYPQVALFLEISPELVDVNVHPTKTEVRFREPSPFGFIFRAVEEALRPLKLPETNLAASDIVHPEASPELPATLPQLNLDYQHFERAEANPVVTNPSTGVRYLGSIHETYLICQSPNGLLLVDQHAAHERVRYEELRTLRLASRPETSRLLIPIGIEIGARGVDLLEPLFAELEKLGLELERSGPGQVRVTELPSLFLRSDGTPRVPLAPLLKNFSHELENGIDTQMLASIFERILLDALATESCHSSVRAGQSLSRSQAEALLNSMRETDYSAHCPHGRPTSVLLNINDLEKLFKRNQ
jgi:DNA mismatch repair protein MutL